MEISLHPRTCRRCLCTKFELFDDARDAHEFHFERITNQHFVEQRCAARMIVCVDKSRQHGHALCVDDLRAFSSKRSHFGRTSDGHEAARVYRKRLGARKCGIDGVDARINDDEVGINGCGGRGRVQRDRRRTQPGWSERADCAYGGESKEFAAGMAFGHVSVRAEG